MYHIRANILLYYKIKAIIRASNCISFSMVCLLIIRAYYFTINDTIRCRLNMCHLLGKAKGEMMDDDKANGSTL